MDVFALEGGDKSASYPGDDVMGKDVPLVLDGLDFQEFLVDILIVVDQLLEGLDTFFKVSRVLPEELEKLLVFREQPDLHIADSSRGANIMNPFRDVKPAARRKSVPPTAASPRERLPGVPGRIGRSGSG
jgi:hypothetical protein